ncbi:hypothetical protein GCM10010273_10450 [Streptomyces lavendulocolor]
MLAPGVGEAPLPRIRLLRTCREATVTAGRHTPAPRLPGRGLGGSCGRHCVVPRRRWWRRPGTERRGDLGRLPPLSENARGPLARVLNGATGAEAENQLVTEDVEGCLGEGSGVPAQAGHGVAEGFPRAFDQTVGEHEQGGEGWQRVAGGGSGKGAVHADEETGAGSR